MPAVAETAVVAGRGADVVLPALIVDAGPDVVQRFLEFFAGRIANERTRAAYGRAVGQFLAWCEARGLGLESVSPLHVAAYIRTHPGSAPTVKQHLAAIRMLCDWLVVNQVLPVNPAAAVRGPKHVVTKGSTPVLSPAEARKLLDSIDTGSLAGLRDRALMSVMLYSFARVSAVLGMRRQDYFQQGSRGWLRLHEKGGKRHDVPAHHRAAEALDKYVEAAELEEPKATLFQSVEPAGRRLTGRALQRRVVLAMIKRRAAAAGLPLSTCCHTFRATGITAYLSNGGTLEHAQQIAGHASPKTTKLYDRTADTVTVDEIDVETHVAVFTWVLERLAGAGLVQGKTVGVDATTLEANAAMRSIERRDTGESYEAFVRQLAKASGIETPTRAELARFDRSRKDRKTSNKEWQSPQDPDAKIAKMKDGRTHLAHKAEHGIDLETGAILSVTVQEASEGDSATLPATLTMAAEQVEAVQPAGAEVEEVVADKGYHSDATLVALDEIGVRSYVSEPERGRRCWQDKKTGEAPAEKRAAQKALYGNRRRIRGDRGRRLQRRRGELVERPFAHQYETGGLRRVWVRGHENVRKRVLIQAAGCNLGLLLRRLTGVGTPRSLQGRALSAICGLIGRLTALWGRLTASWDFQWTPAGLVGSIAHRQAA